MQQYKINNNRYQCNECSYFRHKFDLMYVCTDKDLWQQHRIYIVYRGLHKFWSHSSTTQTYMLHTVWNHSYTGDWLVSWDTFPTATSSVGGGYPFVLDQHSVLSFFGTRFCGHSQSIWSQWPSCPSFSWSARLVRLRPSPRTTFSSWDSTEPSTSSTGYGGST